MSKSNKKKLYVCDYVDENGKKCGFVTAHSSNLTRHKRIHTGETPSVCDYVDENGNKCGYATGNPSNFIVHKRIHTGETPSVCDYVDENGNKCGYATGVLANFIVHKRIHTGKTPSVCDYVDENGNKCGYATGNPSNLTVHKRIHTGEKPYVCDECGYAATQSNNLTVHVRSHTGEKPYVCDECGFATGYSNNLIVHIRSHTGEKPYVCNECGKAFSMSNNLSQHIEAEACWYSQIISIQWEKLCREIANFLLSGQDWDWKPQVPTPDLKERTYIIPEIRIRLPNSKIKFIDAKRSTGTFTYKDLVLYPTKADEVEFWCLFGKSDNLFVDDPVFSVVSYEQLIHELEAREMKENSDEIRKLIMRILFLRKGLDSTGQSLITSFLKP